MASFKSLWLHALIPLSFIAPAVGQHAQVTEKDTAGHTWYYPDGAAGAKVTVRSNPPTGTVTYATTETSVSTDANGAPVLDAAGKTITNTITTSTTTVVAGRTIPTLVYNCEFMPWICKNIQNHIDNVKAYTFDSNGLMKLHADVNSEGRVQSRRKQTCGKIKASTWKEGGFPANCVNAAKDQKITKVVSNEFPDLAAVSQDNLPEVIRGPPDATDPTKFSTFSGLVWTCDEFPSASWIEGGRGIGNKGTATEVICAPMSAACGHGPPQIDKKTGKPKKTPVIYGAIVKAFNLATGMKLADNPSEQNWQASALGGLRAALIRAHRIDGAMRDQNQGHPDDKFVGVFYLKTTKLASPTTSRAWVIGETQQTVVYSKRSLPTSGSQPEKKKEKKRRADPPAATTTAEGPGAPKVTAPPLWRRNVVNSSPEPRGVYHLRGRAIAASQVKSAQDLIAAATKEQQASNARILAHPRVNLDMNTKEAAQPGTIDDSVPPPTAADYQPVSEAVKEAAAIVAEYEARNGLMEYTWPLSGNHSGAANATAGWNGNMKRAVAATSYWYANISPKGKSPFHPTGSKYVVYKNAVADCGVKGDGVTDDTKAIQACIAAQNRCGGESLTCASTSVMPLVLYFPPGNYLVSSNIEMYFQTLLVGDPLDRPRFIAASSFQGLGVLSSDYYIPNAGGKLWYINQSNFFRQVRNIIIDIRNCPDNPPNTPAPGPAALHWQVAQATSLQNVEIYMREGSRGHVGIFMENGSGGLITGVTFHGGYIGLRAGNQQFTIKNLVFDKCRTAIQAIWDWTFLWTNLKITGSNIGIDLINQELKNERKSQQTFAYMLLDSTISATTGIRSNPFNATDGYAQITLDNVNFAGCETAIKETTGATILAGAPKIDSWMWGIVASQESPTGRQVRGEAAKPVRSKPAGLLGGPNGGYFDKPKPQYENVPASSFRNALTSGCKGDGVADDTACLQKLFSTPGYVFVPAGVYRVTDTVKVASGLKIVGEAWSSIAASGDKFKDMSKPHVMVQVGEKGQTGDVEISDIMFQVEGPMAGAVLVEWNMRASSPGSAGMWDTHFRVGGNAGSRLVAKDCPRLTGDINPNCIAVNLMMHITPFASGYFENNWGWTADHDLEALDGTQIDIYTGRGILIESINPTWLYASGFEHAVMYQYMIHGANNLFMGLIQSESPYFQSSPPAPKPFDKSVGLFKGDPSFKDCNPSKPNSCMAWGLMVKKSSNVLVYGAGLYSWFQTYKQQCLHNFECQTDMVYLEESKNIYLYNLATVGTVNMITSPGAKLNGLVHQSPRSNVSSINGWLGDADGSSADGNAPGATITLKETIWLYAATQADQKGTITVACTPPCVFEFPPITYPPLQPPPTVTTWDGVPYTITPPALHNATVGWERVPYNKTDFVTITPKRNQTAIEVPPWPCGAACGGHTAIFPPIPLPIPVPKDTPCWLWCEPIDPVHPPVVIGPGPPPGPPPPGSDEDDDDDDDDGGLVIFPLPGCTPLTCPPKCSGPICVQGTDCRGADCVKGGDCQGSKCTRGGDCEGPKCVRGGECQGDGCGKGGGCKGDSCSEGGGCTGRSCSEGGGCSGKSCNSGGGCENPNGCSSGGCSGPCGGTTNPPAPGGGTTNPPPPGGCTGAECEECTGKDCEKQDEEDEEEDDEDEDDEDPACAATGLRSEFPNIDTPDSNGGTVGGRVGAGSGSGGNVGQGGVNGGGVGCLDDNGVLYPCGSGGGGGGTPTGGGDGGDNSAMPTLMPTLIPEGPDYVGPECSTYSQTTICAGSGGRQACSTRNLCVPTPKNMPTFGTFGKATCTDQNAFCISTTIFTRCQANGLAGGIPPEATVLARGLPALSNAPAMIITHDAPAPTPPPVLKARTQEVLPATLLPVKEKPAPLPAAPPPPPPAAPEVRNNTSVVPRNILNPRQVDTCDYFVSCALCATAVKVPCLVATVSAHMGAIRGITLTATIFEDDVEVCRAQTHCNILEDIEGNCDGYVDFDCGNGNRFDWKQNFMRYYSKKYGGAYPLFVTSEGGTQWEICIENFVIRRAPALCANNVWSTVEGPCRQKRRRNALPAIAGNFSQILEGPGDN